MQELKNTRLRIDRYPNPINDCWVSLQATHDGKQFIVVRTWHNTASPLVLDPTPNYIVALEAYNRQRKHAFNHAKVLFGEDKLFILEFEGSSFDHMLREKDDELTDPA